MAMEILHCRGQAAFLRQQEGYPKKHAPNKNNNTPVNTEVLWFYIWSGGWPERLRAEDSYAILIQHPEHCFQACSELKT